jgi:hypothetical protein
MKTRRDQQRRKSRLNIIKKEDNQRQRTEDRRKCRLSHIRRSLSLLWENFTTHTSGSRAHHSPSG